MDEGAAAAATDSKGEEEWTNASQNALFVRLTRVGVAVLYNWGGISWAEQSWAAPDHYSAFSDIITYKKEITFRC